MALKVGNKKIRRNLVIDEDTWEKINIFSEMSPGEPSISSLVREAINLYLEPHGEKIKSELKRRQKLSSEKIVKLKK